MNSFLTVSLLLLLTCTHVASFIPSMSTTSALSKQRLDMVIKINLPNDLAGGVPGNDKFFDPLGLSDGVSPGEIKRWREAELKHGRLAMLGVIGFLYIESGLPIVADIYQPSAAIYAWQQVQTVNPSLNYLFITAWFICEVVSIGKGWKSLGDTLKEPTGISGLKDDYIPGDLGFDPLSLNPDVRNNEISTFNDQTDEFRDMRARELNNGRLAMVAIAGFVAQELVDHRPIFQHLFQYGLSPAGPLTG